MNDLLDIFTHRSFKLTIILTLVYFGLGFAFLHYGFADYGAVIFGLLPFSLGLVIGSMEKTRWAIVGSMVGMGIFFILLYFNTLEGFVCILLSLPIIMFMVWLGTFIRKGLEGRGLIKPPNNLPVMVAPLLVVLFGGPIEQFFSSGSHEDIEVKTEQVYAYSSMEVYNAIKSVDTLIADKPFLMKLDLPIPNKCILEKEEIGGLRTCYFDGGTITERITELEPGKVLKMDVIDYQLTGRNWLGFNEAIYYFEALDDHSCKMTRITTYTSVLKPRFYWEFLERIGIEQEHQYVFDNLSNDLERIND